MIPVARWLLSAYRILSHVSAINSNMSPILFKILIKRRLYPAVHIHNPTNRPVQQVIKYLRDPEHRIHLHIGIPQYIFPVLKEKQRIKAGSMSGGEQRMVGIGRALMLSRGAERKRSLGISDRGYVIEMGRNRFE
jgi:hypothetical protein